MNILLLKELLEDADVLNFIKNDALPTEYDGCAEIMFRSLSKDLSIEQIQNIIWNAFYEQFCVGTIGTTEEEFALDKDQSISIIGSPERYKKLAMEIRTKIIGI